MIMDSKFSINSSQTAFITALGLGIASLSLTGYYFYTSSLNNKKVHIFTNSEKFMMIRNFSGILLNDKIISDEDKTQHQTSTWLSKRSEEKNIPSNTGN